MDVSNIVHSDVTGRDYNPLTSVRIINIRQSMLYLKNGCTLLDLYVSVERDSDNPVLCFIFDRAESKKYYELWCNYKLS
jgi:hypothetical protein